VHGRAPFYVLGLIASILSCPALSGCLSFAPVIDEPLRVGNVADLSPDALGLRDQVTTLAEARALLVQRGMTGIVEDTFADTSGPTTSVLGADYQSRLLLFVGERYQGSIALPTHGLPPYGMAVRLGLEGSPGAQKRMLLVLYRDPLARDTEPPRLLTFELQPSGFELASHTTLEAMTADRGGMTQPMMLGDNLVEGIMLVARDKDGSLWDTSYLLKMENGALTFKPQSMVEALRCSCVQKYALGLPQSTPIAQLGLAQK
jgi:hypothetical protein